MICDFGFLIRICKHFGVPFEWLFTHFSQILYDEEMWEEAVSDLDGKYFEMSTVHKLLLCRQLLFDFEIAFHDGGEQACLNTIFGRIERILCYIVSDVRNEEFP